MRRRYQTDHYRWRVKGGSSRGLTDAAELHRHRQFTPAMETEGYAFSTHVYFHGGRRAWRRSILNAEFTNRQHRKWPAFWTTTKWLRKLAPAANSNLPRWVWRHRFRAAGHGDGRGDFRDLNQATQKAAGPNGSRRLLSGQPGPRRFPLDQPAGARDHQRRDRICCCLRTTSAARANADFESLLLA
jgi:hypothetical protein